MNSFSSHILHIVSNCFPECSVFHCGQNCKRELNIKTANMYSNRRSRMALIQLFGHFISIMRFSFFFSSHFFLHYIIRIKLPTLSSWLLIIILTKRKAPTKSFFSNYILFNGYILKPEWSNKEITRCENIHFIKRKLFNFRWYRHSARFYRAFSMKRFLHEENNQKKPTSNCINLQKKKKQNSPAALRLLKNVLSAWHRRCKMQMLQTDKIYA